MKDTGLSRFHCISRKSGLHLFSTCPEFSTLVSNDNKEVCQNYLFLASLDVLQGLSPFLIILWDFYKGQLNAFIIALQIKLHTTRC